MQLVAIKLIELSNHTCLEKTCLELYRILLGKHKREKTATMQIIMADPNSLNGQLLGTQAVSPTAWQQYCFLTNHVP